jgi:hypothetical protein
MAVIPLFRPGRHTDISGQTLTFSEADCQASAAAYDPALHEAPLVVGHPQTDAPAYGWVSALRFAESELVAEPHQVDPAFAELHGSGRFKKVSAAFFRPDSPNNPKPGVWYLRHIGFLGAQPPAVKGLKAAQFADGDDYLTVEFAEPVTADPMASDAQTRLERENAQLRAAIQQMHRDQEQERLRLRHVTHQEKAAKLVAEGRISERDALVVVAVLDALADDARVAFAEGEAPTELHTALLDSLGGIPPRVEFAEVATKDRVARVEDDTVRYSENTNPERIPQDQAIRAYQKEHGVNYFAAAMAVMSKPQQ